MIKITSEGLMNKVKILDLAGKTISLYEFNPQFGWAISTSQIQSGTYAVHVYFENGSTYSSRWIKE